MARGGRRAGRPGAKYSNRSDLANAPRTAPTVAITGQGYGTATANAATQQVVTGAAQATAPPVAPVDFHNPQTDNPNEPVTAGIPSGPGPGPEALGLEPPATELVRTLRAMYTRYPSPDLLDLILFEEDKQR